VKILHKVKSSFALRALIVVLAADILFAIVALYMCGEHNRKCIDDIRYLRSVIAEAYINIKMDPNFVNTATEEQPMEIPEKYYTEYDSYIGDGPVHVLLYADRDINAYYGKPERDLNYYEYGKGRKLTVEYDLTFPFILNALFRLSAHPYLVPFVYIYVMVVVAIVTCVYIRHRRKKAFEATIAAIQADSQSDEEPC